MDCVPDTLVRATVTSRAEAEDIFRRAGEAGRSPVWIECSSVRDFAFLADVLEPVAPTNDIYVFFTMDPGYPFWPMIERGIPRLIMEVLFRLWAEKRKLCIIRLAQAVPPPAPATP